MCRLLAFLTLISLWVPTAWAADQATAGKSAEAKALPDKAASDRAAADRAAADQAKARAILEKSIQAHGGEAVLGKFVAAYGKMAANDFVDDQKIPHVFELYIQGDDKMRLVTYDGNEKKSKSIEVVNGQECWYKEGDNPTVDIGDQLQAERESVYVNWATMLVPLLKPEFRLAPLKEIAVTGRKAEGIRITHDKHRPLKFYFDKETHFLVKAERALKKGESEHEGTEETIWSDFQVVQGTRQAMKASILWDGVEVSDAKTTELKLYEKPLDEKLFARP
jgi:hypothetical protein